MDSILTALTPWHWYGFAVILGIIDLIVGANFIFIWCGLIAFIVGTISFIFPITWEWQLLIFGVGVIGCIGIWRKCLKEPTMSDKPNLNRRSRQYIGREFTLDEPIIHGRGRVKVDDTFWRIEGEDLPAGTKIKVVDVNGVVLKVEKQ